MKHLFYGGVHPADKKSLSAGSALKRLEKPKQVIIPMSQHIGIPCTPLVKVGDTVNRGEVIGFVAEPSRYYVVEGPNVYFQMLKDNKPVNPLEYMGA